MRILALLLSIALVNCAPSTPGHTVKKANCAKNAEWAECTDICGPKSCQNFLMVSACFSLRCGDPGCICQPGYVFLDTTDPSKGCVTRETCRKLQGLSPKL